MSTAVRYRFDELGWLQFDQLCFDLLALASVEWEERDFGRIGLAADGVAVPGGSRLEAPVLVVVAWLRPDESRPERLKRLLRAELELAPVARSLVVLTNAEREAAPQGVPVPVEWLGPNRLSALLDDDAELRLRIPSVLGISRPGGADRAGGRRPLDRGCRRRGRAGTGLCSYSRLSTDG